MKTILYLLLPAIVAVANISCKKDSIRDSAALNIIHATVDADNIAVNFVPSAIPYYQNHAFIGFGSAMEYGIPSGEEHIVIVSAKDTTKSLYSGTLSLATGGIYSLYLAGQYPSVDTLFMQDMIPTYADSSAGIRFINLSPGSQPVSINLEGNAPDQTEFTSLGYKQISAFKTYTANIIGGSYNFEVRDQATQDLLSTFSWSYPLYRNNTIVISGTVSNGLNLFSVNNY